MGEDIVQRIDALLKERNEKRLSLAEHCGFSLHAITDWSKRGSVPSADKAVAIANYLGVSIEWLLTGTEKEGLSPKEREMIRRYRTLSDRDKQIIDNLIQNLISSDVDLYKVEESFKMIKEPEPEIKPDFSDMGTAETIDFGRILMIPCFGITAAGSPIDIYAQADEYIPIPEILLKNPDKEKYFLVKVHGFSMTESEIHDGDYVMIRSCKEPEIGKIMLVQHEGQSTLKKIEKDKNGLYRLCWQDGSGRTQTIDSDNWSVLGVYCFTVRGWRQ